IVIFFFQAEDGIRDRNVTVVQTCALPILRWKRDQQFFLFAGIASTNEQAEQMTKTFVDRGLDVYVKEWSIPEIDLQVTEQEYDWLRAFQNQWEKTVKIR